MRLCEAMHRTFWRNWMRFDRKSAWKTRRWLARSFRIIALLGWRTIFALRMYVLCEESMRREKWSIVVFPQMFYRVALPCWGLWNDYLEVFSCLLVEYGSNHREPREWVIINTCFSHSISLQSFLLSPLIPVWIWFGCDSCIEVILFKEQWNR